MEGHFFEGTRYHLALRVFCSEYWAELQMFESGLRTRTTWPAVHTLNLVPSSIRERSDKGQKGELRQGAGTNTKINYEQRKKLRIDKQGVSSLQK